jgi:hypothetical protein
MRKLFFCMPAFAVAILFSTSIFSQKKKSPPPPPPKLNSVVVEKPSPPHHLLLHHRRYYPMIPTKHCHPHHLLHPKGGIKSVKK